MTARATCPTHDTLERLLAGGPTDPPQAELFAHIEQCPECVRTLFDLGKGDTLPDLIRAGVRHDTASDTRASEPVIRRVLEAGPTATGVVAGPDPAEVLAMLSPPQAAGELGRLGAYRVLKLLGHGGMGAVFQAEDPRLGRQVALKVMLPQVARRPGMSERFLREARAAAAVEHDHIVPIFEVNEANGVPYIAMPFLKGRTLADRLADAPGPLPVAEVVRVGREIAAGLAAAHAGGLVHRDVKPANLWLDATAGGRVKVLDFGLARGEEDDQLTAVGAVLGTPAFMAPEQARGDDVDARADLFSLGVVLYRLATGVLPFHGKTVTAILTALATETPKPVREVNPAVPAVLAGLIHRLLAKSPADRPASAAAVATELASVPLDPARPVTRRPWLIAAAVAAALLVVGVGFAAYKMTVETKNGTLVVEVDADAEVRFKGGAVQVYDDKGELKYTLTASEKNKALPPGKYQVRVVGADGLALDTEQFEIGKEGKRVQVRAEQAKAGPAPKLAPPNDDRLGEKAFPGKLVFRDTFESVDQCRLPLAEGPPRREVTGGRYVVTSGELKGGDALLTEAGPGLAAGSFAGQVRAEGGDLVVNVGARNDGRQARWVAVRVTQTGGWSVFARRDDFENGRWVAKPGVALAVSIQDDPALVAGKWLTVAARWTGTEYEVWLNGERVAGGKAEGAELAAGKPLPVQVAVQSPRGGVVKLEADLLSVWDAGEKR